jgi:hypothetical protein
MRSLSFVIIAFAISSTPSFAQNSNQVGTLVCSYGETVGLIVGSRQRMDCIFHATNGDTENYAATFTRIGLDIGVVGAGKMAWAVFAKTNGLAPRALVGDYLGASAEASVGFGGGANVLVGGSARTITLQPVSLDAQAGANVALGVGKFRLR